MYTIKQEEPEGWEKAFAIYFAGKRVTHCSYRDTAQHWIADHIA
ncbi:hypothetical protein [Burkholderia sp. B21-005]|nr:hypothetical protein [Burkholderia sp. B21-005]